MKHIILASVFLAVSSMASANWFSAAGVTKQEWRALPQDQKTATKKAWAQKWGGMSKAERQQRLEEVKSGDAFEKWLPVSAEDMKAKTQAKQENAQKELEEKLDKAKQAREENQMKTSEKHEENQKKAQPYKQKMKQKRDKWRKRGGVATTNTRGGDRGSGSYGGRSGGRGRAGR